MYITYSINDILNILTIYKELFNTIIFNEITIYYSRTQVTEIQFGLCKKLNETILFKKYLTLTQGNVIICPLLFTLPDTLLILIDYEENSEDVYYSYDEFKVNTIKKLYDCLIQQIIGDNLCKNMDLKTDAINNVLVSYIHNFKCARVYHPDLADINIICL
jgi:hypothetical protein